MDISLCNILRAYGALARTNGLKIPNELSSSAIHAFFLESLLLNAHFQQYPPSDQYQRTFWKWAINVLENLGPDEEFEEIDPRIYEHYLSLLPSSGITLSSSKADIRGELCLRGLEMQKPSSSYLTYYWSPNSPVPSAESSQVNLRDLRTITLLESRTMIEHGTTGMRTWLASFVLGRYLVENPALVQHKKILELGSGIGFLGIMLAQLQLIAQWPGSTSQLWLTDVNERVLSRCKDNLQLPCNGLRVGNIHCCLLDWFDAVDPNSCEALKELLQQEINTDMVLGADIIFDPSLIPPLTEVIAIALQNTQGQRSDKIAIIAATIRNADTFAAFLKEVEGKRLQTVELHSCKSDYNLYSIDSGEVVKIIKISNL